jgi:hypothetical protein
VSNSKSLLEVSPFLRGDPIFAVPEAETTYDLRQLQTPFFMTELEWEGENGGSDTNRLTAMFKARATRSKVALLVSQAAKDASEVEVLVYVHGLDVCPPAMNGNPLKIITSEPFKLGDIVEHSHRPMVLVVPFLDWGQIPGWPNIAKPSKLNGVIAEALDKAAGLAGRSTPPAISRLILSGHSRAFGFFDGLAAAHADREMLNGALAHLSDVWALDSTYTAPINNWEKWLHSRNDFTITVIYRTNADPKKKRRASNSTGVHGEQFRLLGTKSDGRLTTTAVPVGKTRHCDIPGAHLPDLLANLPAISTKEAPEEEIEAFIDFEDEISDEEEETEYPYRESEASDDEADDYALEEAEEEEPEETEWFAEEEQEEEEEGLFLESGDDELEDEESEDEEYEAYLEHDTPTGVLESSGLTPAEYKAVLITSTLETGHRGGFFGLSGNFDGQGLSFGLVNWTIGTGSLQPLLREFAAEQPDRWKVAFGPHATSFLALISKKGKAAEAEQLRFAVDQMNESKVVKKKTIWSIREPWHTYFTRLSEDPEFQRIQVRHVRTLLNRARYFCERFGLTSERAYTFMFDAVSSHGQWWISVKHREALVKERLDALETKYGKGNVPEEDVLLAIADVLGETSAKKWGKKARVRKRWFVTHEHPRAKELAGLEPRADVPYSSTAAAPPPPPPKPKPKPTPAPTPKPATTSASTKSAMSDAERAKFIAMAVTQAKTAGDSADRAAIASTLRANGTDVDTWFADFVPDATFLGQHIRKSGGDVPGVHRKLLEALQRAERALLAKHPDRTAAQLGKDLGIYDIAGLRPPKKATGGTLPSFHCFGLAVDINHDTNPFVGNLKPNKKKPKYDEFMQNRSPRIIERAMWLLHGEKFNVETALKASDAGKVWDIHHRASDTLAEYLRLADDVNGQRVQSLAAESLSRGDSRSLEEWRTRITEDRAVIKYWDFPAHKHPELTGYMDLPRELVVALAGAGLLWGGQYKTAKDMMHFDLREGPITQRI